MNKKPTPSAQPTGKQRSEAKIAELTSEVARWETISSDLGESIDASEVRLGLIDYRRAAARALLRAPEASELHRQLAERELKDFASEEPTVQMRFDDDKRGYDISLATLQGLRAELEKRQATALSRI